MNATRDEHFTSYFRVQEGEPSRNKDNRDATNTGTNRHAVSLHVKVSTEAFNDTWWSGVGMSWLKTEYLWLCDTFELLSTAGIECRQATDTSESIGITISVTLLHCFEWDLKVDTFDEWFR